LHNISRVIAEHCGKTEAEVYQAMLDRTTLDAEEAMALGLVQKLQPELVAEG